jgi:glycosyltransferase involved in cell wall biosynthesis
MGFDPPKNSGNNKEFKKYQPYILSIGRLEKRKNTLNIIKSYLLLRKERKIKHKLLLAGKPGYGYAEIKTEIEKNQKYKNDIVELGFVSNDKLSSLYTNAAILLYPSLYEGFGYPILEAYSYGVPVITANTSSMPEVANGGALLVNPNSTFEIAAAMSQIINKPEIANKLNFKAKKVLTKYSWERCAEETLNVILEK